MRNKYHMNVFTSGIEDKGLNILFLALISVYDDLNYEHLFYQQDIK